MAALHCGVLAGIAVLSQIPFLLLQPATAGVVIDATSIQPLSHPVGEWTRIQASLLDAPMAVSIRADDGSTELQFADGSRARVASSGLQIDVLHAGTQLPAVLMGPLLLLALAQHGVFCLHASAYLPANASSAAGPRVLLAASGIGKSTLARTAAELGGVALIDDLCPVRLDAQSRACVLPRFPQLKWSVEQHWPAHAAAALPLARLGLLQRASVCAVQQVEAPTLLRACIAHTVAARLFTGATLQRHLRFCAALVERLLDMHSGEVWQVREAADDPTGAMLELLQRIERGS